MKIDKERLEGLREVILDTITELVETEEDPKFINELSNKIYDNVINYLDKNKIEDKLEDKLIEKEEEIKQLKKEKDEKLNVNYPKEMNNFINEVKLLNKRINEEYNDYLYQSLKNETFIKECINSSSMKSYYNKLIEILNNYKINSSIITNLSNDIIMIFISPGVKASIRGAKLNNIIDELISKIPEINNDRFKITFEAQPINVKCPERPDFVILDKETNKEIVGYTQVELWNGMKNRADKYVRYNPHDNVFILCVVARKAVIEYKYSKENIRNIKYEVFKYGYEHNKVCYVNNLQNIICQLFNIQKITNVNINYIVDFITNKRLSNINKSNDNITDIIDREDYYLRQNKLIEERNLKKEDYINRKLNFIDIPIDDLVKKYTPLDELKNDDFHFVNMKDEHPDFDIAIKRNSSTVGNVFLNDDKFKYNPNSHLIIKCDTDIQYVYNNLVNLKDELVIKARNKLKEGKTRPFISRDDIFNAYNDKYFK